MKGTALPLALLFLISVAACSRTAAVHERRLVVGLLAEPTSLNPLLLQGTMAAEVSGLVFSRLVSADARGRLVPDLALRVPSLANGDVTDGGKIIRYHLRPNVLWQDDKPLTSADVVFTYDAIVNPRNPVPSHFGYDRIASVRADGPLTVLVTLKEPYSPILSQFFGPDSNYPVLPAHLLERYPSLAHVPFNQSPIGSGPYRVATWAHGDYIRYVANARYYGGAPRIAEIVTRFIPNSQTILAQLETGEIDATFNGDTSLFHAYASVAGHKVLVNPLDGAVTLIENTSAGALRDVRVRRAIAASIDAPQIARLATGGVDSSKDAAAGLFSYADDPSTPWVRYDPALARRLLNEAGFGSKQLTLQLTYLAGEPSLEAAALLIEQDLAEVGVRVQLKSYYASEIFPILASGHFQAELVPMYAPNDPDTSWFWACSQVPPGGFNLSRYCDPTIDLLTREAASTFDLARRIALYRKVERLVARAAPIVILWRAREIDVVPAFLHGYPPGEALQSFTQVQDWYLSRS